MTVYELRREAWVPRPVEEVFAFFSEAGNLDRLTPAFLRFRIERQPECMKAGARIHYRLNWHGIPLRWETEITAWDPPRCFTDVQLRGPYRVWEHTHEFREEREGTTLTDYVRYALPFGAAGAIAHALTVRRDVERIFDYRARAIRELFGGDQSVSG